MPEVGDHQARVNGVAVLAPHVRAEGAKDLTETLGAAVAETMASATRRAHKDLAAVALEAPEVLRR